MNVSFRLVTGATFVKFAAKGIFSKSHERRVFVDWKRGTLSYTSETFPLRDVTAIGGGKVSRFSSPNTSLSCLPKYQFLRGRFSSFILTITLALILENILWRQAHRPCRTCSSG
jgi:hypothetical protein